MKEQSKRNEIYISPKIGATTIHNLNEIKWTHCEQITACIKCEQQRSADLYFLYMSRCGVFFYSFKFVMQLHEWRNKKLFTSSQRSLGRNRELPNNFVQQIKSTHFACIVPAFHVETFISIEIYFNQAS